MKISSPPLLGLLALIGAGACHALAERPGEIISIADARARVNHPIKEVVTVTGQVTFSNERLGMAFVQDKTGGIGFDPRGVTGPPALGSFVKVTGVVTNRPGVIVLRTENQPLPAVAPSPGDFKIEPLPLDLDNAVKTRVDGLLTQVTGVVRSITVSSTKKEVMSVELSFTNGSATVILPWIAPEQVRTQWLNRMVVCEGVLVCPAPPQYALKETDALLLVPNRNSWTLRGDLLDDLFAQRAVDDVGEISAAPRVDLGAFTARRILLSGVVTASCPKEWVCLRMAGGSVQILSDQVEPFEPGTQVSAACCPQMRRGRLVLMDGVFRRTESDKKSVLPVRLLRGDQAEANGVPMELVQVRGVLRNDPDWRGLPFLSLTPEGGTRFLIQWDTFLTKEQSRNLLSGSEVSLTGILKPLFPKAPSDEAPAFALIPRSTADVQVLRDPSWWTRQRLVVAAVWLTVISALGICTTLISRSQIRKQRKAIREAETLTIAMEERNRIARELHDSFQQHLTGVALHLEAMQGAATTVPHMLPQLLGETAAMVRHCQIEARHCIWDLRSSTPGSDDLPGALSAWLRMKASGLDGIVLDFIQEGEMPLLSRDKAFQILRIVQESVNNALAHAGARQITVRLQGDLDGLHLSISDDGCGFDVDAALLHKQGKFGLRSLRERSARIQGGLEFESQSQQGTRVILRVAADPSTSPSPP